MKGGEMKETRREVFERAGRFVGKTVGVAGVVVSSEIVSHQYNRIPCSGVIYHCEAKAQGILPKEPSFPKADGTGVHFAKEEPHDWVYPGGYSVDFPTLEALNRFGGIKAVGGVPESRAWTDRQDITYQLFPYCITQFSPDGTFGFFPVFDWFSEQKLNDWLASKQIPAPRAFNDINKDDVTIEQERLSLFDNAPELKSHFLANPLWRKQYGLPQTVEQFDLGTALRAQAAAWHMWQTDIPWARAGEITQVNTSQLFRETPSVAFLLIPPEALTLEMSDRWEFYRARHREPNLVVTGSIDIRSDSEIFRQEAKKILQLISNKAPRFYETIVAPEVQYIADSQRVSSRAIVSRQGIELRTINKELNENEQLSFAASIAHETGHIKLGSMRLEPGGLYGEAYAVMMEVKLGEELGSKQMMEEARATLKSLDDPRNWWWVPSAG